MNLTALLMIHGPIPVEIKSSHTIATDFFKEITFWHKTTNQPQSSPRYLIYGGSDKQSWPQADVISWKSAGSVIKKYSD